MSYPDIHIPDNYGDMSRTLSIITATFSVALHASSIQGHGFLKPESMTSRRGRNVPTM
jgi:hypothetical protein